MEKLKLAVIGCGFWASYQIAAWIEVGGIEIIALCDNNIENAKKLARKYSVENVFDNAAELFNKVTPDFVDIITNPETHAELVELAASKKINTICQKPMSVDLLSSEALVRTCNEAGIKFYVHENFRWQAPIRKFKEILDTDVIGKVFKSRISFCSAFPVFENQPFLAELDQFIIADVGSHVLDIARYFFGEVSHLLCKTNAINRGIKGEDVANVLMEMKDSAHCFVEMSYASILEKEAFPQTLVLAEGERGSIKLEHDFIIKVTTSEGTKAFEAYPEQYDWVNPDYASIHASMVGINRQFLNGLRDKENVETTGEDNLETLKLVYACYESAEENKIVKL
ncbi:MAG: Gfo/Idh/MocA family oxidoreductase [Bacteroidota bacterium]